MSIKVNEMVEFLNKHFRYFTMNSWNGSKSFAANVKVYNSWVPSNLRDAAYTMLETDEVRIELQDVFNEFALKYDYNYQMCWNGRSGGYIVLIRGGKKPSGYKSVCIDCGQRNYKPLGEVTKCGFCGLSNMVEYHGYDIWTQPGKSIEIDEDAEDSEVEELYNLVKAFDAAVEKCKRLFLYYCKEFEVVEEEVLVPQTVKVLRQKELAVS
jgi:hypothetical protein